MAETNCVMKHFSDWQWADYTRGVVESAARTAMDAHLSSGCRRCGRLVDAMRRVTLMAQREGHYEPPAQAIRNAQAIYALYAPEKDSLPKIVARLVHDSFRAPLPAGLRTRNGGARRAMFEAGSYSLDVQLEHRPASGSVTLIGQLANRARPDSNLAGTPVWLKERKGLVATTVCNQFGEFQFEYQTELDLRLYLLLVTEGKRLEIPLDSVSPAPVDPPQPVRKRTATRK
jgi:hypothetical protein